MREFKGRLGSCCSFRHQDGCFVEHVTGPYAVPAGLTDSGEGPSKVWSDLGLFLETSSANPLVLHRLT